MTAIATVAPTHDTALSLAAALFVELDDCEQNLLPNDVYFDTLSAIAFGHLVNGAEDAPPKELRSVADAIEKCSWLVHTVRTHLGRALRATADGDMSPALLSQIVAAAANYNAHQIALYCMRAIGAEGLYEIANVIEKAAEEKGKMH